MVVAIAAGSSCWAALVREAGSVAPGPVVGDWRPAQIKAYTALILRLVDQTSDITPWEIQAELANADVSAGIGTLWHFVDQRQMIRKKRPPTLRSRTARTS